MCSPWVVQKGVKSVQELEGPPCCAYTSQALLTLAISPLVTVTLGPILLGMLVAMATSETTTTEPEKTEGLINSILVEINNLKEEVSRLGDGIGI